MQARLRSTDPTFQGGPIAPVPGESPASASQSSAIGPKGAVLRSGPGYGTTDGAKLPPKVSTTLATEFPDLTMPVAERRGVALMKFSKSKLLELEGYGDLAKARAMLAPMGLEPVPTPSGHARVSIGSMRYRFFAGLFNPAEVWLAVVARPIGGGPTGHAYLHTVTDSRIMKAIGSGWGIPYEKGSMDLTRQSGSPDAMSLVDEAGKNYAGLSASPTSSLPTTPVHQEVDFQAFSPTGKTMEVHIEGPAQVRAFDTKEDRADFAQGTAMRKLQDALTFEPKRWVSHDQARGAIRARLFG